jgi:hypothetical protein
MIHIAEEIKWLMLPSNLLLMTSRLATVGRACPRKHMRGSANCLFFIYNLNQQSEFTFYKLILWLLQCLDGESSSGESPVPQIMSIGQIILSRLFSSLNRSFLRNGFSCVSSLVWWLLHFWWMTFCTYHIPRSACSLALETYHGASTIILRILDWLLWIIDMLDLLAQPHNSRPYVEIGVDWNVSNCSV